MLRKLLVIAIWGLLGLIVLGILFYIEEDWRGARAWAATKAEWEAKGESFDYSKFIPPSIPDDQNLGALPLFKLTPAKDKDYFGNSYLEPASLDQAMRPGIQLPPLTWQKGELPDMAKLRATIGSNYSSLFKGTNPPQDTLAQFRAIYPFLSDFIADSANRPLCRFNLDYTFSPPLLRNFGVLTRLIKLSQITTFHAILALDHRQSDLALEDIKTNFKLLNGVKCDPTILGSLVADAIASITDAALFDGLSNHTWSDAQLVELDRIYKPVNFLADYQSSTRSEAAESYANITYFKHASRSELSNMLRFAESYSIRAIEYSPPWPGGWWDDNIRQLVTFHFDELAIFDPRSGRVFPDIDLKVQNQIQQATARWDADAPWNCLVTLAITATDDLIPKYARGQVLVDEARIACALERYRLIHGVYPESLGLLAPTLIEELPHDIMNGQPYHYHLQSDGTFLLYSVGWNQIDDGGQVVYQSYNPKVINYDQGDWVWPSYPNIQIKK